MTKIATKEKKARAGAKQKTHDSVADMIREVLDDDQIADHFERYVIQRQIVKNLMVLRCGPNLPARNRRKTGMHPKAKFPNWKTARMTMSV